jgi:error-prone DNA polymerase
VSEWDCTLEPASGSLALRLGFRLVIGLPQKFVEAIVAERQRSGPFRSLTEFASRTQMSPALLAKLSEADAFASLARDRRAMLWESLAQDKNDHARPLLAELNQEDEPLVPLPALKPEEQVLADYRTTGLSLKAHPLSFYRDQLNVRRVARAADLPQIPDGRHVRVAGLVILRQRPGTAKGITFVTLEDETGVVNLVVKQAIWEKYYQVARRSPAWIAHGKLEQRDGVIHVVVNRLEDMAQSAGEVAVKSRDFR